MSVPPRTMRHNYSELSLGAQSRETLLKRVLGGLGFTYSGAQTIPGMSGMRYSFDAIGTSRKNVLLVVGGAEVKSPHEENTFSPRKRMEIWRDRALLSAYDVQNALERDGCVVDLMFFHNLNHNLKWEGTGKEPLVWLRENHLPEDVGLRWQVSIDDIPVMASEELATMAQSIGACFLTLDDLQLDDVALLTQAGGDESKATKRVTDLLTRRRVIQYFQPPTDELILSGYGISARADKGLVTDLKDVAMALGHPPVSNVLVPEASFLDPVQTAQALEKSKYISFESRVQITESGFAITQSIRKTAQASLVLRVLKTLGLSNLAKAIIQAIKRP